MFIIHFVSFGALLIVDVVDTVSLISLRAGSSIFLILIKP